MIQPIGSLRNILAEMGLDVRHLGKVEPIRRKHDIHIVRIAIEGCSFILKLYKDTSAAREARAYALLADLGVPTLRVFATKNDALLLEDLEVSKNHRLASEEDVGRGEVGAALAEWYRALHDGDSGLWKDGPSSSFLRRESDALTADSILELATRVRGSDRSRWSFLADNIDRVKNAAIGCGETLTHGDFHWTNLALSRNGYPIRAVVFDYHLMGLGLRYSDCRNVTGSLGPEAAAAFRTAYGETDPMEKILDDLTAPLCALIEAFRRPRFPSWAEESLEIVETEEIHRRFDRAMKFCERADPGGKTQMKLVTLNRSPETRAALKR